MSIRKRLASFIFIMMSLLILLGGILFLGGPVILGAFGKSLSTMDSLNSIRELRSAVNHQRTSLNRYLLLDDNEELLTFEESSLLAQRTFESLKNGSVHGPLPWVESLLALYTDTQQKARVVLADYKKGNKARAFEAAAGIFEQLSKEVATLEKTQSEEAGAMFMRIHGLIRFVKMGVFFAICGALLVSLVLFRSLYRAVMKPLEVLKKGADEFGQGHWDNRIQLTAANEFGALADSFNTMAENVKQLQLQAAHMDRMSAVGQLAGGVAHEINNPLTAVLGQAQILLAKLTPSDPAHAQLTKIENAALRCKKIVRGLLDFSRPSQAASEDIDANSVLLSTLDLCEADLKKSKVTVEKKLARNLPVFQGNSSELQQVLLNLVNNAIQAMPKGGMLTLDTHVSNEVLTFIERRKGMGPRRMTGPWVEIIVRDTGIGIAKEHLTRVFEPFFTTKEIGKGTGLGLAVSLGIVQKHGGDIRVDSGGLNKGATFTVVFPQKKAGTYPQSGMAA